MSPVNPPPVIVLPDSIVADVYLDPWNVLAPWVSQAGVPATQIHRVFVAFGQWKRDVMPKNRFGEVVR